MSATSSTPTAAAAPVSQAGFTRKASGLVRDFSQLDAWIYNVLAINIVLNVATSYALIQITYGHASMWLAFVIAGVFCVFEAIVYAMFVSAMPRSGGDYVFQSRIFGGGVATFFVFTGVTIAQIIFIGLAGWLGANLVFGPFLLLLGAHYHAHGLISVGNWFITNWGVFFTGVAIASWSALVNIRGLRLYALLQRYFFWVGFVCMLIVILGFLFTSHASFVSHLNNFVERGFGTRNVYAATIKAGGTTATGFSLSATLSAAVIAAFALIYPAWGVMQAGEIKRANSVSSNLKAIVGAEVFSFVFVAIMAALLVSRVGAQFLYASGSLFLSGSASPLPVPPFFGFFAALTGGSAFMIWVAFILFVAWYVMWIPNVPLGGTRVMVAMSFDKILPEWVGKVNRRTHTPINAILAFSGLGLVSIALYSFSSSFVTYTLGILILGITAFAVTMLAAIVFPYTKTELYKSTGIARYKVGPFPAISVCAAVFLVFCVFCDYQALTKDALGINGTHGLIFLGACYAITAVIYLGTKLYRKRTENLDLSLVYQELPIE
jgi:APA family basic amino acid/polyamine antiporter